MRISGSPAPDDTKETWTTAREARRRPETTRVTLARLRRFESIQDLLAALGYREDQAAEVMYDPWTGHQIAFSDIATRSVADFVRWGLGSGWLGRHIHDN